MQGGYETSIQLRALEREDFEGLLAWFDDKAERFLERPDEAWLRYVLGDPRAHALLATREGEPVAHAQVDVDPEGSGSLALLVRPEFRRHGYARAMVRALVDPWCRQHGVRRLVGYVDPLNQAAIRLCQGLGFGGASAGPDEDGLLKLQLDVRDAQEQDPPF